jgi:hypothetical protein
LTTFKERCKTLKRGPQQKGSPRITSNGGYVQLPGTDKALLVESCAADGNEAPKPLVHQCIHFAA